MSWFLVPAVVIGLMSYHAGKRGVSRANALAAFILLEVLTILFWFFWVRAVLHRSPSNLAMDGPNWKFKSSDWSQR